MSAPQHREAVTITVVTESAVIGNYDAVVTGNGPSTFYPNVDADEVAEAILEAVPYDVKQRLIWRAVHEGGFA